MDHKESFFADGSLPFCMHDARGDLHTGFIHNHDCLEINYVLGGAGINYIDGRSYEMQPGDVFLINNYEHHFAGRQSALKMKVLYFDPDFIWDGSPENYRFLQAFYSKQRVDGNRIHLSSADAVDVMELITRMEQEYRTRQPGFELFLKAGLLSLLAMFYRLEGGGEDGIQDYSAYEKIQPALSYVHRHYSEALTLENLAGCACMSRTYFSAYFKSVMGIGVARYVEQVRIHNACRLLTTTSLPVTEIAYECGYQSMSSFTTAFRRICGETPTGYRKSAAITNRQQRKTIL